MSQKKTVLTAFASADVKPARLFRKLSPEPLTKLRAFQDRMAHALRSGPIRAGERRRPAGPRQGKIGKIEIGKIRF